jgi:hypothetical protein
MNSAITLLILLITAALVVIFVGGGAYLLLRGLRSRSQGAQVQEWPYTTGVIRESTVRSVTSTGEAGEPLTEELPYVRYTYTVNGKEYHGSSLTSGLANTGRGEDWARKLTGNFPLGSTVTVWYNPKDPADSVIEKRSGSAGVNIGLGAVLLLLSLGMICLFFAISVFGLVALALD